MSISRTKLPRNKPVDRHSYILDYCNGKKILHLGCADSPFTNSRLSDGSLLHTKLCDVTLRNVGVDIDNEAIILLQRKGIVDVFTCDVTDLSKLLKQINYTPEVVVASEILEHLPNPGIFLQNLAAIIASDATLLISVPNAYCLRNFFQVFIGHENTHPEHLSIYSLVTLDTLLTNSGFFVDNIIPYTRKQHGFKRKAIAALENLFLLWQPYLSQGLIAISRSKSSIDH